MFAASKKFLALSLTAAALATATLSMSTPAEARYGRNAAFGIGLGAGLLLGGVIGSQTPAYGYDAPVRCRLMPVYDDWGYRIGTRRVCQQAW